MTATRFSSDDFFKHPGAMLCAAAGAALGLAANFGRKAIVQGMTAAKGEWDEGLKAEHRATLKLFDAIGETDETQVRTRKMLRDGASRAIIISSPPARRTSHAVSRTSRKRISVCDASPKAE